MKDNEFFLPPHVVNEVGPVLPQSQTIDWWASVTNIPKIHSEFNLKGRGVTVGVVDTGIDENHPDLIGAITKIYNATNEPFAYTHGHGIGVAGMIGARDNNTGVLGAAPECKIIGAKGMRENGGGSLTEIIRAGDYVAQNGANIINFSLGTSADVSTFRQAVNRWTNAGIIVVASAGNSGQDNSVVFPARYDKAFAIGATNQNGQVSSFSSRGWEVDIAAPGERVLTTWKNKSYARVSGTSFSAPLVSGLIALMLEAGINVTQELLKRTAIDIEEPGEDTKSGHGLIDAYRVIKENRKTPPTGVPTSRPTSAPTKIPTSSPTQSPVPVAPPVDFTDAQKAYEFMKSFLEKNDKLPL